LRSAQRTYSTYDKDFVGFWAGGTSYERTTVRLKRNGQNAGDSYSATATSNEVRELTKFYRDAQTDTYYWVPAEQYTGNSRSRSLDIEFTNFSSKPLLPWEKEEFVFALRGTQISLVSASGAYEYDVTFSVSAGNSRTIKVDITADQKKKTAPSSAAVGAQLEIDGGALKLVVTDSHEQYYQGETLEVRVIVYEAKGMSWRNPLGLDSKLLDRTLQFSGPGEIDLQNSLGKGKYYIDSWSFRRKNSQLSTSGWVRKGKGNTVTK